MPEKQIITLEDVPDDYGQWGCVDRREGPSVYYGIAGAVDGLVHDAALAAELDRNQGPLRTPDHLPALASVTHRALETVGVTVDLHEDCKAIDYREAIVAKIIDDPELVLRTAQDINPTVTDAHMQRAESFYMLLQDALLTPDDAKRFYGTPGDNFVRSLQLVPTDVAPEHTLFVVNNSKQPLVRTGQFYDFSQGMIPELQGKLNETGLFRVRKLGEAAAIRAAAVKLVLPGPDHQRDGLTGPRIVHFGEAA